MLMQLALFLAASLVIGLTPVYVGARVLRTGNPSFIGAVIGIVAVLALQDMAFKLIDDTQFAWLASIFAGAFAVSLVLDCPYWKAVIVCVFIILIQLAATSILLEDTPAPERLNYLVTETQKELWPDYN
ncbi:hypothetical protein [Ferrimonas lipolytica]|uniref:Uncharacterized protein n=1 Tax=Ferrimonas lipolytica TaxID=2724191 RepID=A0A6H1UDW9_9GAMM|nr:hypothetical protein [Ferrimonas lipolytica]QIZ75992.1 hypothetical protein HER31_03290 [Ferrimonas lipolytica]